MYIHEKKKWPEFYWDEKRLAVLLGEVRLLQGRLLGRMSGVGFQFQKEASFNTLTQDVIKSSEIEGEKLDKEQVRSSIAKRLGINIIYADHIERDVEGIVSVMLDATQNYSDPLTKERLFKWHRDLFPNPGRIVVGAWRGKKSDPMQVISGPYGREKVHYEAPNHDRLKEEMKHFIDWFNASPKTDLLIQAAIAHLWFVTIHPFDDGNGRIARAIADMVLARSEKSSQRFYSMSSQIRRERSEYYDILEKTQKGDLDISEWLDWFLGCLKRAIIASEGTLDEILKKANFWKMNSDKSFNDRQRLVINRLLDGFEGKLTSSKWAKLTKCSQDTALRDIKELLDYGVLSKSKAAGRSTGYELRLPK